MPGNDAKWLRSRLRHPPLRKQVEEEVQIGRCSISWYVILKVVAGARAFSRLTWGYRVDTCLRPSTLQIGLGHQPQARRLCGDSGLLIEWRMPLRERVLQKWYLESHQPASGMREETGNAFSAWKTVL